MGSVMLLLGQHSSMIASSHVLVSFTVLILLLNPVYTAHDRRDTKNNPQLFTVKNLHNNSRKHSKLRVERPKRHLFNGLSVTNNLEVLRRRYVEALRQRRRSLGKMSDNINANFLSSVG